jgi:hypothetical protein
MEPWYKVATPRKEVREGRSFNPDEFAIALEPVVAGTAPQDYCDPEKFFSRTCFTRALREHAGVVLRRIEGKTEHTALALENKGFFIRKVGSDGFQIRHQATLKKVVSDRRASLDEKGEVKPEMRRIVKKEFEKGASIPLVFFPSEGSAIQDSPKLTLVIMDPDLEWTGKGVLHDQVKEWTRQQGKSPRLYPGSLIWCLKRPGRDFQDKAELSLAWMKIAKELSDGTLGSDFDRGDRADIQAKIKEAEETAREEVWGGYRFVVLADNQEEDGLKVIDLGAGHASAAETLCGRVIAALESQALLNDSVGAGYIDRNWPPALKESGAWPLASLRQSFLNGALTRLIDPDGVLKNKIVEFVAKGDLGLASGQKPGGTYERVWFSEHIPFEEVSFDPDVYLLTKKKAKALKTGEIVPSEHDQSHVPGAAPAPGPEPEPTLPPQPPPGIQKRTIRLVGTIPPEVWNRLGTKIIPKLKAGDDVRITVDFSSDFTLDSSRSVETDLKQIIEDLGLKDKIKIQ